MTYGNNTFDDIKDEVYGQAGTPRRDKLERELDELKNKLQQDNSKIQKNSKNIHNE